MYLRFVVGTASEPASSLTGVIIWLDELRWCRDVEHYDVDFADELLDWFDDHLPVPPYSRQRWSSNAVCWFKDSATDMIDRVRDAIALLENNDRPVRHLVTDRPGMILYEDDFQVVAQSREF